MSGPDGTTLAQQIKARARQLGFDACGVARAGRLHAREAPLREWLDRGLHAGMGYMDRHHDKRLDPRLLLPGAQSLIVLAQNYFPTAPMAAKTLKVSKYAYGKDYHSVLKQKMKALVAWLESMVPGVQSRCFTDSAPLLEKSWAQEAGLGRAGKNTCLILPGKGSFFFLGEILTTLALPVDAPYTADPCQDCNLCMQACPTGAILSPRVLDAGRCLSYLTIECPDPLPTEVTQKAGGWFFGCDVCQDVCPHNRHAQPHQEEAFRPLEPISTWTDSDWAALSPAGFRKHFIKTPSPLGRVRHEKLRENIARSLKAAEMA